MVDASEMFKPTEAAVVSGVALGDVNRVIDRNLLPARLARRGRKRGLSAEGCFYTAFYYGSAKRLTAEERRLVIDRVHERVGSVPERKLWATLKPLCVVEDEFLHIDLAPFLEQTNTRWDRYLAARAMVTSSPDTLGGALVIEGTRVPVHDVAASVAAGVPMDRILEAYPSLRPRQVELADLYAKANPPQGRPLARPIFASSLLLSEAVRPRRRSAT